MSPAIAGLTPPEQVVLTGVTAAAGCRPGMDLVS